MGAGRHRGGVGGDAVTPKDGGPAFPTITTQEHWVRDGDDKFQAIGLVESTGGMSLRDFIAIKAMQGLIANPGGPIQANGMHGWGLTNCRNSDIADVAYDMADAMLKARQS